MDTVLKDIWVKTRKPHKCICCGQEHPKGSKMRSVTQKRDGNFDGYYLCGVCNELYYILRCDWSDGIRYIREELMDSDVIWAMKRRYCLDDTGCDWDVDTVTGKIDFTYECVTGETCTCTVDLIEAAKESMW